MMLHPANDIDDAVEIDFRAPWRDAGDVNRPVPVRNQRRRLRDLRDEELLAELRLREPTASPLRGRRSPIGARGAT